MNSRCWPNLTKMHHLPLPFSHPSGQEARQGLLQRSVCSCIVPWPPESVLLVSTPENIVSSHKERQYFWFCLLALLAIKGFMQMNNRTGKGRNNNVNEEKDLSGAPDIFGFIASNRRMIERIIIYQKEIFIYQIAQSHGSWTCIKRRKRMYYVNFSYFRAQKCIYRVIQRDCHK